MRPDAQPGGQRPGGRSAIGSAVAVTILGSLGGWLLLGGLRAWSGADAATFGLPVRASVLIGVALLTTAAATAARAAPGGRTSPVPLRLTAPLVALPAVALIALHLLLG